MKYGLCILLAAACLTGSSWARVSHYTRNEVTVKFDGKVSKMIISSKLIVFDDINPDDYNLKEIGVPLFGELKDAMITVKSKEPKPKVYHKKDALIASNRAYYELVSDSKIYTWGLGKIEPGDEIEYSYEIEDPEADGGNFLPLMAELPVDTAIVTFIFPSDKWRLKYSLDRGEPAFIDSTDKAVFSRYGLQARDQSPYKKAPYDFTPGVWFLFESKTQKTDINEWQDVYLWYKEHVGNTQSFLNPARMVSIASTPEGILSAIDKQCHYVAIEIGKGSYVPSPPDDVWNKGYGDCKGLATLFMNWMKAAGYDSWQVLVKAGGDYYGNVDYPAPGMFDHMIAAYVTLSGDTVYQDLTAEAYPLGYLPTQLYGCLALPLLPNAQPFRLGVSPKEPDTLAIKIEGDMNSDGILVGTMNMQMKGRDALQWNYLNGYTRTLDREQMLKSMLEKMLPNWALRKIDEDSVATDQISLASDINIRRFCVARDSAVEFKPWGIDFIHTISETDSTRSWPTIIKRNMLCKVSYQVKLIDSVYPEPGGDSTGHDYGNFSYKLNNKSHDDSLLVDLELYLPPATLSPETFKKYIDERKAMLRDLESRVTFPIYKK